MSRNITITEIAKEAGVSKSTVSRVLNNKVDVLPETKKRVLQVVKKYNFQPNAYAKGISQKYTRCIGVVVPHDIDYIFKNQYYSEIQRAILKTAQNRGYYVLVICCRDMKEAVDAAMQKRVDGLIIVSPTIEHKEVMCNFLELKVPFVIAGLAKFIPDAYQVFIDDYYGATLVMQHLAGFGHKRIAYINGPNFFPSNSERYRAYWDFMISNNFKIDAGMVQEGGNTIESGYSAALTILTTNLNVTAIFTASDYMAIGAEKAVIDIGLKVPDDISIVGFDNVPISEHVTPAITTIDQSIELKGKKCVDLLIDIIEKPDVQRSHYFQVPLSFIERDSTSKVKQ